MKYLLISNWLSQLGLAEYCMLLEQYDSIEVGTSFFNKILEKMSGEMI